VASDPKTFDPEAFCEAVRSWTAAHPGVRWLDIADVLDTAPNADALARYLADPESTQSLQVRHE
jgi:hypothetical protein